MSKKVKPFRKKPKHQWLADIICVKTPKCARKSCKELTNLWKGYSIGLLLERKKKRLLIQSVSEAIRRSKAQLARKTLSTKEQKEFKQIVKIYAKWLKKHRLIKR